MTQLFAFESKDEARPFFVNQYRPLLDALPGLKKYEASEVQGLPLGTFTAHLIVDLYFNDEEIMDETFASAEGKRISRVLTELGGKNVEVIESKVLE